MTIFFIGLQQRGEGAPNLLALHFLLENDHTQSIQEIALTAVAMPEDVKRGRKPVLKIT